VSFTFFKTAGSIHFLGTGKKWMLSSSKWSFVADNSRHIVMVTNPVGLYKIKMVGGILIDYGLLMIDY
jgi:hypothetical protein